MSNIENVTQQNQPQAEPATEVPLQEPAQEPVQEPVQEPAPEPLPSSAAKTEGPTNWVYALAGNFWLHVTLRILEVVFAILVMALTATSIAKASWGDSKTNFGLAVSVITLFYFVYFFVYYQFFPAASPVIVGLVMETVLMIFWFCAFIVLADNFSHSCDYIKFYYDPFTELRQLYGESSWSTSCKAGKASAAFAAFNWLFFLFTMLIYILNVAMPVVRHYGTSGWSKLNAVSLNPFTFLSGTFTFNNLVAQEDVGKSEGIVPESSESTGNQVPTTTV